MANENLIQNFLEIEKEKALLHNISFNAVEEEKVLYAQRVCSGFFESKWPLNSDNPYPCLTFATKKSVQLWLPIAVHETCHMDQYIEHSPYWMDTEQYALLDLWLEGKNVEHISTVIDNVILMEADCEKRTIEKIKQYNLPISVEYYAQRANSYLYFHHWMKQNKKWCDIAPYEISEIINSMPKEMTNVENYINPPSQNVINLFNLTQK